MPVIFVLMPAIIAPIPAKNKELLLSSLFPKQPQNYGEDETYQQTGSQWEVKGEIAPTIVDISRQPAKPPLAKARPE